MGELISQTDFVTAIDYGQIYLFGWSMEEPGVGILELASRALTSPDRVAGDGWQLVVLSPHRYNFDAHFSVEHWDGEPPDDLDEWQEVVEGGLVIEDEELAVDSPTIGAVRVPFPSGYYTARVSGRGFIARGDTPSTKPGDVWRVQLWTPNRTRRLRTWVEGDRA
jgi:hypothetical protein